MAKIPLTVITGYLGSGKTTLLRNILENAEMRMAVVMNEFGEIGIDSKVIKGKNVDIAELAGGCVCCSLTGEFEEAIKEIIEKAKPEWIVLETTGVAEPDSIIINVEEMPQVRLDSVITIVDADAMARYPEMGRIGHIQIETADIILLNKKDLVTGRQLEKIEKRIREINPSARIFRTEKCGVDVCLLLGIEAGHKEVKAHTHKDEAAESITVYSGKLDKDKFLLFAENIPENVYRAKGIVVFDEGPFLFNYVAGRFGMEKFEGEAERTEIVFIGTGVKPLEREIAEGLEKCRKNNL